MKGGVKNMEHRNHSRIASTLNVLAGIWLIISPFIFVYTFATDAMWNSIIFGVIIGILALIRASNPARYEYLSWANFVLGLWVVVSTFLIAYPTVTSAWNNVITGLVVVFLAVRSAIESHMFMPAHSHR